MTLSEFSILIHHASNNGKLTTVKRFKDLTNLRLSESKDIIDNFGFQSANTYIVTTISIKNYMRTLPNWKEIKSHIRKIKFDIFIKEHNITL